MNKKFLQVCFTVLCFFAAWDVQAGGPINVAPDGTASTWSGTINLHPEGGVCGSFSNAQMITKLDTLISRWTDVTGVSLSISIVEGSLPALNNNVNEDNFNNYYVDDDSDAGISDSLNPIIFDNNGEITAAVFGTSNRTRVLGFAGPDAYTSDFHTIVDGQAVFNCRCLPGNIDCGSTAFSEDLLNFTIVHEMGHFLGLDHSTVYVGGDCDSDVANDCFLSTMYPSVSDAVEQQLLARDDEVAILALYGSSNLNSTTYTATGIVKDANNDDSEFRCVDVQAQSLDDDGNVDGDDVISTVSGIYAETSDGNDNGSTEDSGECLSGCGNFTLRGLDPAKKYRITLNPINSTFVGGSAVAPCINSQISSVETETVSTINANTVAVGGSKNLGSVCNGSETSDGSCSNSSDSSSDITNNLTCSLNPGGTFNASFVFSLLVFLFFLSGVKLKASKKF